MRIIGIRHRRKRTKEGEPRPTMVAIREEGQPWQIHELVNDTAELDFVRGHFPIEWRPVEGEEPIAEYGLHRCQWRTVRKDEDVSKIPEHHLRRRDGKTERVTKVPIRFDGLKAGDKVAMLMGGSGDRLAVSLSRRGEDVGAEVYRIPPFALKEQRGSEPMDKDHGTLAELLAADLPKRPEHRLFYQTHRRDRDVIRVTAAFRQRVDTMKERIACGQRLDQRLVGAIFLSEDGLYPEGTIEEEIASRKENDAVFMALTSEEKDRDNDVEAAVKTLDVWRAILADVKGLGPRIAAGLISAIGTIQRFEVHPDLNGADTPEEVKRRYNKALSRGAARLKAYCGVHVLCGGKYSDVPPERQFPRRREDSTANWAGVARQSLYLLLDQFNRSKDSPWGLKLREYKVKFRTKHPEPVKVQKNGEEKSRYTDGHIHRMAIWRTATKFVEWLYRAWINFEHSKRNGNEETDAAQAA